MKIDKLTPAISAKYLAENLDPLFQKYVGKVCLFWDESNHYYGCYDGWDDGTVGLIRKIKASASDDGNVDIIVETCSDGGAYNVDTFYIVEVSNLTCINDELDFSCDEDGNFEDIELEPLFDSFELNDIVRYSCVDTLSKLLENLIVDNFKGKMCIIENANEDEDYDIEPEVFEEVIEDVEVERDDEHPCPPLVFINDNPIHYQYLTITKCEN